MDSGAAFMLGLFAFLAVSTWASSRREQREMELRYELYRRMVEHPGPEAEAVRALLKKETRQRQMSAIARKRAGGLVLIAVAIGFGTFLYFIAPDRPVSSAPTIRSRIYLLALVPGLVGLVMLVTGLMARRSSRGDDHARV